jgi:predicted HTH domain antitoxin
VARLLGVNRWEAESWLGERGVCWNYGREDLEEDWRTLEEGKI